MILIADSGSSKTDWVLWDTKTKQSSNYKSIGLNPFFIDSTKVEETIKSLFSAQVLKAIKKVFFYGAGCGNDKSQNTIKRGIESACTEAQIEVSPDLLAAARALCGHEAGIVCLLGTGSNSCVYDGEHIVERSVSFGYAMGDEGSGNHMGRQLLKSIFTKNVPDNILEAFIQEYPQLDLPQLLNQLYHSPSPNKFLAGFSLFIKKHSYDPFIKNLIDDSFDQFCDFFIFDFVKKYDYPTYFLGSIAWNYKKELTNRLKKHQIKYAKIIQHPIEALLTYHKNNLIK